MSYKFPYKWNLADGYPAKGIEAHGLKVFGTFICGGGSSMGYKLAGFNHLGGVEIDQPIADVYEANHHPKYLFNEDIRKFVLRDNLPEELFKLDLLDGSPPCSSFSMAGNRDKDWGKEKVFREGQAKQKLDDLFFTYIELAKKLQPKVVIAENVKGLLQGNAKVYVKNIVKGFNDAGYNVQFFLINAASMGVPQRRERVFFICHRKDLNYPKLVFNFNEKEILFGDINPTLGRKIKDITQAAEYWDLKKDTDKTFCDINKRLNGKANGFGHCFFNLSDVANTIVCSNSYFMGSNKCEVSGIDFCKIGSYPQDYNFKKVQPKYLIGMSVPPVMTAQIAHQIYLQWLKC